jgi:tetratricopeptide (TPR) repeat protein
VAYGRPEPDPPPGPVRELVNALRELHARAGLPSRRKISHDIRQRHDLRDTVSHETVSAMLRGDTRPSWLKYETVVRYLAEYAVYQPDEKIPDHAALLARFHRLWLACEESNNTATPDPVPLSPVPEPDHPPPRVIDEVGGDPPPRNTRFVGREHQIRAIHEILRTGAPMLTLTGIGGVGKTQLAAEYVYRFRDEYDVIWWVPAEHTPPLRASLAALGSRLDLPRSGRMQHPPAQVLEELRKSTQLWLLVFDNARSPDRMPLIRPLGTGKMLITTRDPDWRTLGPALEIGVFERQESIDLLRARAANIPPRDANIVAEKVGDLPLAVDQVANWHVATGTPVVGLLDRLDRQAQEILSDPRATTAGYPATLAGVLRAAFEQLTATAPVAAQLVELFAWLGAEPVSLALLRRGRHGQVSEPLGSALSQETVMNQAVKELHRLGLINTLGEPVERVQMHRVFQSVLRDWLERDRLTRGRDNLREILTAANPGEPDDWRFWPHYQEVGPHIHRADLAAETDFEVRRVVLDQARYLYRVGHYEESMALSQSLVAADPHPGSHDETTVSDADHNIHVLARLHLANAARMRGHYTDSSQLTLETLAYMDRYPVFGPDHEYRVIFRNAHALDLRLAGKYEKALAVDSDNLHLGDADDRATWRTNQNNIAVNYRLLGRFAEAYEIDDDIVRGWDESRRDRDPRALLGRCNLARDLYGLGRYREALEKLRTTLPIYREVVGDKHASVLLATRVEAMALRKLGRTAEAVSLARENHHDTTLWFDSGHEYTLASGMSLVNALLAAGDLGNATIEAASVLARCERIFGDDHPFTLAMLVNSAAVLRALGNAPEARRRDERATIELGRALGDAHPYTLCARHNFAVDLAILGTEGRALDEFRAVLRSSDRGAAHPDHIAGEIDIALARIAIGGPAAGQAALAEATTALATQLGSGHPAVLAAQEPRWIECEIEPPAT